MTCVLHKNHAPLNHTVEQHHVIPVAWQMTWQPPKPWPNGGKDTEGRGMLWDARVTECCPTGHRNVHFYIVAMMHNVTDDNPQDAITRAHIAPSLTSGWAGQALRRFAEAGGSLTALVAAHEWGQS